MPRKLRLTLAQLNPTVGDIKGNATRILDIWEKYDAESDLVIFPELFLSGYPPEDLIFNDSFMKEIQKTIENIIGASQNFKSAAVLPAPLIMNDGSRTNSFLIIEQGEVLNVQSKVMLPNYGVFDELRTFVASALPFPIAFRGVKLGFLICEDIWYDQPMMHLKDEGAELLIVINGSPFDVTKREARFDVATQCIEETDLSLIYLNMVGGQDELVFDGHSFIMPADGQTPFTAKGFQEDIIQTTIEFDGNKSIFKDTKSLLPASRNDAGVDDTYEAILLGLRDYVHKNGFKKVLLGLSGGIDSALVAVMAVDALGAENVRCIMLPSEFTSKESLEDAEECARNLGVKYEILPIRDAVKTFEKIIPNLAGLAHENTQSRIRGVILMALSNLSNEMLLSTGNKSELATGYATLYGDMNGGYNPLKDLYKLDVYEFARMRNAKKPVIPQRIIDKAPSAELRANQTDQDSLPPYNVLDDILFGLIEMAHRDMNTAEEFSAQIRDNCLKHPEEIQKVAKLLRNSEFKRFQSCPGPKVSTVNFGKGRRYPITNKFLNRIEKP